MFFQYQCIALQILSLYVKLLTPSSVSPFWDSTGITLLAPLLWISPTTETLFFLVASSAPQKFFLRNVSVLPSSNINNSFARYGLRSRHVRYTLTITCALILVSRKWTPWPCALWNISGLDTFTLAHCGWQTALPVASYDLLPPHTHSSVPCRWLTVTRAGLSNLLILALLGALIILPLFLGILGNTEYYKC